jgi:hypothetical protein
MNDVIMESYYGMLDERIPMFNAYVKSRNISESNYLTAWNFVSILTGRDEAKKLPAGIPIFESSERLDVFYESVSSKLKDLILKSISKIWKTDEDLKKGATAWVARNWKNIESMSDPEVKAALQKSFQKNTPILNRKRNPPNLNNVIANISMARKALKGNITDEDNVELKKIMTTIKKAEKDTVSTKGSIID